MIGRFRITYTEDDRIRELMLPAQSKLWSSIGPFPAQDVTKAYTTVFEPEKDIKNEPLDLKKSFTKVTPPPAGPEGTEKPAPATTPAKPAGDTKRAKKEAPATAKDSTRQAPVAKVDVSATGAAPSDAKPAAKRASRRHIQDPTQQGKPSAVARKENNGTPVGPAEKPSGEATKETKTEPKPEVAMAQSKDAQKAAAAKPKPDKITWTEQRKWRDGTPARLQGANSAYYLARKIVATRPRTAMVEIDGPAGFRLWINGELAQTSAPPPPPVPPKQADAKPAAPANSPDAKTDEKDDDEKEEPVLPEINDTTFDASTGRAQTNPAKKFRIGLRQGDNEIVVKIVFGGDASPPARRVLPPGAGMGPGEPGGGPRGGGSFTFTITPEGDDVLTHEVATALRLEAKKPAAGPSLARHRIDSDANRVAVQDSCHRCFKQGRRCKAFREARAALQGQQGRRKIGAVQASRGGK